MTARKKSVFITGASSGLGQQMAREFSARGYNLALAARRRDLLDALRSEIAACHDAVVTVHDLDVVDDVRTRGVVAEASAALGGLDIVIANAGVGGSGRIGDGSFDGARRVIDTNVTGAMATVDAAVPHLKRQGYGQIVLIGSVAGYRGLPGSAAYSASKAAIATYAEALRAELWHEGIKVTLLAPGYIDTPINQKAASRPFVVPVEKGAAKMVDLIERGVAYSVVPVWPWVMIAPLLRILPTALLARR